MISLVYVIHPDLTIPQIGIIAPDAPHLVEREPLKMLVSLIDWMASKGVKVVMRRPVIGAMVMDELVLSSDLDRVLSVSLMKEPLGPEPSSETFKRLADFKSLDTFRKYVAGFFMRERD